ncbi:MAG: TRAP transporter small permease subunit, partial [Reyranella sp.]|nr:TRAP transporter small permease subunit [Reyranella sp.]
MSHVEDSLNLIAAFAIFFLMFVGVAQIVGRTVFDFAIYGYIDWIEQASVLFAFLGIAYAQRLGSHIGMDLTMG